MSQFFTFSWWFSFGDQIWPWWLACAVLGLLALPLTLRLFEGVADAGAGLSIGIGIILTSWTAWALAHVGVPHGRASVRAAAAVLATASLLAWARRPQDLSGALRSRLVPFLAAQLLFAIGFLYFCNVRSYVPWATFDVGLSGAEKAGNLMHLNSAMRARAMPPGDAWFLGEPTNYYYGGHVLVAALAKLTGTPARLAFNYGLATIFALSLSMGFSLAYSMAVRRGPRARRWRIAWPAGLAWGLLGGLAIAVFGNLDAWRQLGKRAAGAERWSLENLKTIDYWASSRAILGAPPGVNEPCTITEFPYFSAMLGDLHPHHMALPFTIVALAACLAVLRRNPLNRVRTEADWRARAGGPAAAMGVAIGAVFPVNIWDAIVLSLLYLLIVVVSRRGVEADVRWRWLIFPAIVVVASWLAALAQNVWVAVPVFGTPAVYGLALLAMWVAPPVLVRLRHVATARALVAGVVGGAVVAAVGGAITGATLRGGGATEALIAALRDGATIALAGLLAAAATPRTGRRAAWVVSTLASYAAIAGIAILVASPFLLTFRSPLGAQAPLLESLVPPHFAADVFAAPGALIPRLWSASPVNPFSPELRSSLPDFLAHWGLFVLPLVPFVLRQLLKAASVDPCGGAAVLFGTIAVGGATLYAMQLWWVGPLSLSLAFACLLLAVMRRSRHESPALLFAGTGFFWCWFVEALHFDDSYGGALERYNTPFKIFYPLWPMFVAALIGALRALSPRIGRYKLPLLCVLLSPGVLVMGGVAALVGVHVFGRRHGLVTAGTALGAAVAAATLVQLVRYVVGRRRTTDAPALAAGLLVALLGLLYPFAATATRTRSFFSDSIEGTWMADPNGERIREFYTRRTLDALAWLGQTKRFRDDLPAINWLLANAPAGAVVLEAPSHGAYTPEGRVASMTGLPTLVGWRHHQNQWRGWGRPLPERLQRRFLDELADALPVVDLGIGLPRHEQIELYRASLVSKHALEARLQEHLPAADRHTIDDQGRHVVTSRHRALTAVALTDKLGQRMGDLWRAPRVDDEVRRLLALYRIRYVFAGSLERAAFGATADTFAVFPRVFVNGETAIYEVPEELRNIPSR